MKYVEMEGGNKVMIDDEHYEWINSYNWHPVTNYSKNTKITYATTLINGLVIYMHRFIMKAPKKKVVHHIDGDGLNNQKNNLEIVSHRENLLMRNWKKTSKYPGVSWNKQTNKWIAIIQINGRPKYLGAYHEEWRAAKAYRHAFEVVEGKPPKETYQKPKEAMV